MQPHRRITRIGALCMVAFGFVLVLASTLVSRSAEEDKGIIANLLSRALSTPTTSVSIGEVQGALSSDATIRDITIADRDGVWLQVDQVRLIWRRTALLLRRLEVDRLEVGTIRILRKPLPAEQATVSDQPLLPELPLKVEIKDFTLRTLALAAPVLGEAASLTATGAMVLGNPAEGLNLRFDARRQDKPGHLTAGLELVPQGERLSLKLTAQEPAGGLLVRALNVPGLPPLGLDLNGEGMLDAFAAQLAFDAGERIGATGSAQLRREGTARRLALDLDARIEGLLPSLAAPVFAGTTQLDGTILFADSSAIEVRSLSVASRTARLDVQGTVSSDQVANLRISAQAVPNSGSKTTAGDTEVGKLAFDATITGPIAGPAINATLDARDVTTPQGRAQTIAAKFIATPSGSILDQQTSVPFDADARVTGLSLTDPSLAAALGTSVSLRLEGSYRDAIADLKTAHLQTATSEIDFVGRIGQPALDGQVTVKAPDLTRFGELASLELRGALDATAKLTGVPREGRVEATVTARATAFATGVAPIDGLLGGRLDIDGGVRKLPRGGYGFGDLRLTGAHVSVRANGEATAQRADIDARLSIPDLKRADARLSGRAEATVRLSGTVDRPDAVATVTVTNAQALRRPIPRLTLELMAADITGLLDARVVLSGTVDSKPAQGRLHVAKRPEGGWTLDDLNLAIGSVRTQGNISLDSAGLAEGRLTIDAGDLDDLSPLVLTPLSGRLRADATLSVANGGQGGTLTANGQSLKIGPSTINRLTAQARVADVYRRPVIDADITVDRARIADEAISQIRLIARGAADASAISLTANARGFAIEAKGQVVPAAPVRLDLSTLTARRGQHRLDLLRPTSLTLDSTGVGFRSLSLALDRGRLSIDGRVGSTLELKLAAQSVPLSISETVMPNLGLSGTLTGEANIAGTTAAPTGTWNVRVERLVVPQTRDAGLPPVDVAASGRLANRRSTVDATVRMAGAGTLRLTGTIPLQGGGLDLTMQGRIDLGLTNESLSATGRRVTGNANVNVRVTGSLARPDVNGSATITGAAYADAALGIRLTGIDGRLAARGTSIAIERLSAKTPNGGSINAQGNIRVDPAAGFPGTIQISGRRAQLVANDTVTAVANLTLTLSGPLTRNPQISGRIDVVSLDVTIPDRLPAEISPIEGTRHVAPTQTALARLAVERRARARARRGPAFDAALDLSVNAPNRVFVRGRGIDAELGGNIRLRGRLSDPVTVGSFELRRGRMSVAGTRLDFTRGRIAFTGNLAPDLDLVAQTRAGDVTATIAITGPATQPTFVFSSEPDLPQEEVLSRILFSKASGGLSAIQAVQLAQVAAQFSGRGGSGVFERLRRSLGVDSLDVSVGASGNPRVGISRAINRRISIGVKAGSEPEDSAVSVDIDVTRNIRLQGEVNSEGGTAVGVGMEWEY